MSVSSSSKTKNSCIIAEKLSPGHILKMAKTDVLIMFVS